MSQQGPTHVFLRGAYSRSCTPWVSLRSLRNLRSLHSVGTGQPGGAVSRTSWHAVARLRSDKALRAVIQVGGWTGAYGRQRNGHMLHRGTVTLIARALGRYQAPVITS